MAAIVKSITVALLMLGLISGCASVSKKWYGTWEGDLQRADPATPLHERNTINLLRIRILPDGTFEMLESGIPIEGTCVLGSKKAFLRPRKTLGQPVDPSKSKEMTLTWQDDGTVLWTDPGGFDGGSVRLSMKPQPGR
jgi:hypothetical protein